LPNINKWEKQPIIKLTKDTLQLLRRVLRTTPDTVTLIHYQPVIARNPTFDKVVISYQSDRLNGDDIDMLMDSSENILYRDVSTGDFKIFSGNLSKGKYKELREAFNQVNLDHLKDAYFPSDKAEHPSFNITFVKNDRIYKNISDYDGVAPLEFISAYRPLIYLGNSLNLKHLQLPYYLQNFEDLNSMTLETDNSSISFKRPQQFLLFNYLKEGKLCSTPFKKRFVLRVRCNHPLHYPDANFKGLPKFRPFQGREEMPPIVTDGRYFKFAMNGKECTVDIGFNFYDMNAGKLYHETFLIN
jgi:hypothetical protein